MTKNNKKQENGKDVIVKYYIPGALILISVMIAIILYNVFKTPPVTDKKYGDEAPFTKEVTMYAENTIKPTEYIVDENGVTPVDESSEEVEEEEVEFVYTVNEGDTLWAIADAYYNGKGEDYVYIAAKNNIRTPLEIGQQIIIPTEEEKADIDIKPFLPTPTPKPTPAPKAESAPKNNESQPAAQSAVNNTQVIDGTEMEFYANCKITGYAMYCGHCNGRTDGLTASGIKGQIGTTVAMTGLPFGTKVYIEGYGYYVVHDRGAFGKAHVDIACNDHAECNRMTGRANVYIVK